MLKIEVRIIGTMFSLVMVAIATRQEHEITCELNIKEDFSGFTFK